MTVPDETPRATLREDERAALVKVLLIHRLIDQSTTDTYGNETEVAGCEGCPWAIDGNCNDIEEQHAAHVAEQIAPLVAAACAEACEQVAVAIEVEMTKISPSTMLASGARDGFRLAARTARIAARIARTAPSTDQETTPPGVTGGSGEDEGHG